MDVDVVGKLGYGKSLCGDQGVGVLESSTSLVY